MAAPWVDPLATHRSRNLLRNPWMVIGRSPSEPAGAVSCRGVTGNGRDAIDAVTVEYYDRQVVDFFADAVNPHLNRTYRSSGYAPMVELLRYLEAHGSSPITPRAAIGSSCGRWPANCTASHRNR